MPETEPTHAFINVAPAVFEALGIPFYDVTPTVAAIRSRGPGAFIIQGDGHPNERGAALIAQTVWREFLAEQLARFCEENDVCSTQGSP